MSAQEHCDRLLIIHDKFRSGMFGQREVWEEWLRDAVAALRDPPCEQKWQPIETAPKDGTNVLACSSGDDPVWGIVYWRNVPGKKGWRTWFAKNDLQSWPQFWMPLPPAASLTTGERPK